MFTFVVNILIMELPKYSHSELNEAIEPYKNNFKDCYLNALNSFNEIFSTNPILLNSRTKATLMHNLVANEAKKIFGEREDISIIDEYETVLLVIKNVVSVRFKKLNDDGLPSNAKTKRNDGLLSMQTSLFPINLLDSKVMCCLTVGYKIDEAWSNFTSLTIQKNEEIIWVYNLSDETLGNINYITDESTVEIKTNVKVKIKKAV